MAAAQRIEHSGDGNCHRLDTRVRELPLDSGGKAEQTGHGRGGDPLQAHTGPSGQTG